jgi:amino acid adenylation domain-containing protein
MADIAAARKPRSIPPRGSVGPAPLSFAQERLWFLDQLLPGSALYNISRAWRLQGPLNVPALKRALTELVQRHEALRTVYPAVDGRPVQVVAEKAHVDLRPQAVRPEGVDRAVAEEIHRPFDLAQDPMLRAALFRVDPEDHVLAVTTHHISSDAWSMRILIRELTSLYGAFAAGRPADLPELPVQYADYAVWQREEVEGEKAARQLEYWKRRLAGSTSVLDLPADYPRPGVLTHRGARLAVALPPPLAAAVRRFSQSQRVTPFATLLTAFQILLHRYSGQDDLCIGTAIANRDRTELEGLIGFFVNTLVLRANFREDPTFRDFLRGAWHTTLEDLSNRDAPFERLLDVLPQERGLNRSPFFQASFVYHNTREDASAWAGLTATLLNTGTATSKFDLGLQLGELRGAVDGWVEYSTELFAPATIERLWGHYQNLLEAAMADPDRRISALPLLAQPERRVLVEGWRASGERFPERTLHEWFEEQARRAPDAIAVTCEDRSLTYSELNSQANRVAHALARLGVKRESRVGISLERSPQLLVAILGVLKAGGAYVPLDPAHPAERRDFLRRDAGVSVVLTASRLAAILQESAGLDPGDPTGKAAPENLAYLMYTSGSTGTPKGVLVTHGNVTRLLRSTERLFRFSESDVWTLFHSFAFDFSVWEMWGALLYGGRLVVTPYWVSRSPEAFCRLLREQRVTVLNQTPTAFRQLLEAEQPGDLDSLRLVIFGGEALDPQILRTWWTRHPAGRPELCNMYGITETTVHVTWRMLQPCDAESDASVIGRPLDDLRLYLLDRHGEPVPPGFTGEIYVGGAGVARGYWNRPDLAAERFVPDPFATEPGSRLYRSGDLARMRPGGELVYLGRADEQVKIRGHRVEPREVEVALVQHPEVKAAAVVAQEEPGREKRLVAYVVGRNGTAPAAADLRRFLQSKLPEPMTPSAFVSLEALPITANGKVDRRALAPPPAVATCLETAYVAPRNALEEKIASLCAELLRVDRVGATDNFFELGGHSLLAVRAVNRISDVFSVNVPVRTFYESPTVAALAQFVAGQQARRAQQSPATRIPRREGPGPWPLSFAQERLWFLDQFEPGSPVYVVPVAYELDGPLDVAALRSALNWLVVRHEALHTVYRNHDGGPVQVVGPFRAVDCPVVEAGEDVREALRREAARTFDLSRDLMLRATVFRIAPRRHVLLLALHHIAGDGWSVGVLLRELSSAYSCYLTGEEPPDAPLPVQYADFAVWQRHWLESGRLEKSLAYWKKQLDGVPTLETPSDRPRPARRSTRGGRMGVSLPASLCRGLREVSSKEGATLFMTLLAGFQALLHRYTGQTDFCVGAPIANRTELETEGLIGYFANTLALRADLRQDPSFRTMLARVRATALDAYTHQDMPFERLVEALQVHRSLAHTPLFQVMFVLQTARQGELTLPGVQCTRIDVGTGTSKFDLTVSLREAPPEIAGSVEFSADLFDEPAIERLWDHYRTLLSSAVEDPDRPISRLALATEVERKTVLVDWSRTAAPYPRVAVHRLFEARAAERPDCVAVVCGGRRVTYGDLNRNADRVAQRLRRQGVAAGDVVGVLADRSIEMITALLGILKAGGAYLPLDPADPPERRAWMVCDAGAVDTLVPAVISSWLEEPDDAGGAQPEVSPDDLAYVMYTSGSTGDPKGVETPHRAIVRLLFGVDYAQFGPGEVFLQMAPVSFDASTLEIWGALLHGARLVLFPGAAPSPSELDDVLAHEGVTTLWLTASLFHALVDEAPEVLRGVRQLLAGGEALSAAHIRRAQEQLPGTQLINGYGPTEGTTFTCCWRIPRPLDPAAHAVPIGRPIGNTEVYILDEHMEPVPAGVPGELYIGGDGLARGYRKRPALTAERFVPHPFGRPGARLYRTGDRARWRSDGVVEFWGRFDDQVKVRGFRVEPGEIAAVLERHPAVREAHVAARDRRLVAYVVPAGAATVEELLAFLRARLPEYMIPVSVVLLARMPRTPRGKVDRNALPAPEPARQAGRLVLPCDHVERALLQIWREVLGWEEVGVRDDFFQSGGSSLLAVRLFARIERRFQVKLPLATLFQAPTVEELAGVLRRDREASWSSLVPMQPGGSRPPLFCVHAVGGNVLSYRELVACLGPDQPVYGLQAVGLDGRHAPHTRVEDMAAHYLREVRTVQPAGPYHLAGMSFGGVVAFEMARQLEAAGKEVALLALFDTYATGVQREHSWRQWMRFQARRVAYHGRLLLEQGWHEYWRGRRKTLKRRRRSGRWRKEVRRYQEAGGPLPAELQKVHEAARLAARQYRPQPYGGSAVLFRALDEPVRRTDDPSLGWAKLVRTLEILEVPGGHLSLLAEPHVRLVAEQLRECLNRGAASSASSTFPRSSETRP